ncbi:MAG: hypothetical protein C0403_02970 [Desulfobacterium sp.]|nr:hypothetical protein [Desulfobacterium sp.]
MYDSREHHGDKPERGIMGPTIILCFSIQIRHPFFAGFREALPSLRSSTIIGLYSRAIARTYQDSGHVLRLHPGIILYATGYGL